MIINDKKKNTNDIKFIMYIVLAFAFVVWLCTPPGNKFLQICFWGNNTKYFLSQLFGNDSYKKYVFHRNNAVYLAKMYPNTSAGAFREINKAIEIAPNFLPKKELEELYKDRAEIRLYYHDTKGALSDFIKAGELTFTEYLKVALLFNEVGNYRQAASYCNMILTTDYTAYSGFACLSTVYTTIGKPDASIKVWNLAIDRMNNKSRAYVERANVKKSIGDMAGYNNDIETAKNYNQSIDINYSIVAATLNPKRLNLSIK